jgi:hypothetical protein
LQRSLERRWKLQARECAGEDRHDPGKSEGNTSEGNAGKSEGSTRERTSGSSVDEGG